NLASIGRILCQDLGPWVLALGTAGALFSVRNPFARWITFVTLLDVAYAAAVNPMGIADRQTLFVTEVGLALLSSYAVVRTTDTVSARYATVATRTAIACALLLTVSVTLRVDSKYAALSDGWSATEILGGSGALGALAPRALVLCESDDLCGSSLYAQF